MKALDSGWSCRDVALKCKCGKSQISSIGILTYIIKIYNICMKKKNSSEYFIIKNFKKTVNVW